jgi:hypothetical protein
MGPENNRAAFQRFTGPCASLKVGLAARPLSEAACFEPDFHGSSGSSRMGQEGPKGDPRHCRTLGFLRLSAWAGRPGQSGRMQWDRVLPVAAGTFQDCRASPAAGQRHLLRRVLLT